MLLKKLAVAFVVVGLLATAAFAQNRQVNVVNNTSMSINRIAIARHDAGSHEFVTCSGCPLASGRSQIVNIPWGVGTRYSMTLQADEDVGGVYFTSFYQELTVADGRPTITFTDSNRLEEEVWEVD